MDVTWFYLPEAVSSDTAELDENNSRHALQVLRMREGDPLVVTNGQGWVAQGRILSGRKKQNCTIQIEQVQYLQRPQHRRAGMAISPLKQPARLEWFLEKATELGVSDLFPVTCHRTVKDYFRIDRLQGICISAMLQSRQAWLPVLHQPVSLDNWLSAASQEKYGYRHRWIAHCGPAEKHLLARTVQPGMQDSLLLIGPEGDFTDQEIHLAQSAGFMPVSLGATRLRTETAGVVGASLLCLLP